MYSLTGTTAIVEKSMNQCAQMAIAEINAKAVFLVASCAPSSKIRRPSRASTAKRPAS
jgi:hypothetical protein